MKTRTKQHSATPHYGKRAIWRQPHWRDFFLCTAAVIAAFALFHTGGGIEAVFKGTRALGDDLIQVLLLTSVVALVATIYYAVARTRERASETRARQKAEEELAQSLIKTETERALRLGRRPAWDFGPIPATVCETNLETTLEAIRNLQPVVARRLGPDDTNTKAINQILSNVANNLQGSILRSCAVCHAELESDIREDINSRRRFFLLRLLTSRVAPFFKPDVTGETPVSREFVVGFDLFLRHTFGDTMYDLLNEEAGKIMRALPSDIDSQIWLHLMADERYRNFGLRLLTKLQFGFEDFARGRAHFMTIVGKHGGGGHTANGLAKEFTDQAFATIFSALFGDLWEFVETEENRIWLDYLCGFGAAESVRRTCANFSFSMMALMPEPDMPELLLSEPAMAH